MWLDIILGVLITYGFYTGFNKGLIDALFDTLSLIIAILFALKLSPYLVDFLDKILPFSDVAVFLIGFVLTFLIVMIVVRFIGNKIEAIFKFANVNILNKIAGGLLRAIILATLFSFAVLLLGNLNIISPSHTSQSRTYRLVEPFPRYAETGFNKFKPVFSEFWDKTIILFDEVKNKREE